MQRLKPILAFVLGFAIVSVVTVASPIKNWTTNEYVTYSDLNAALNHLHASAGHGHGPVITAADISSSAGIRPEQTTFGSSLSRNLVHTGTWKINPDAGVDYIPVNYSGTLSVAVSKSTDGYAVTGATSSGTNVDGGSAIYTVISQAIGTGYSYAGVDTARYVLCWNNTNTPTFASPLAINYRCQDIAVAYTTPTPVSPQYVTVEVYNNKVQ